MNRAHLWAWGTFVGLSALGFILTASVATSLLVGAIAGSCVLACALRVTEQWRRQAQALASAARGLSVDPEVEVVKGVDPVGLAREVQAAALANNETTRKLSVLRAVIDGMAEGVWITTEAGTVVEYNNALKEFLYTGQEIVGRQPADLLEDPKLQIAVEKACRQGVSSRLELNVEGVRPCVLSVHVSPLGRELGGSSAVFFDVTELRRLETVRKDFVANVSHELRTPITAIRGYAETLQSGAINDAIVAPKMVDIIHRQAERLSELVQDLLELSKLESRQIQLAHKPVELLDATVRALEAVRPKAKLRGTALEVQVPAGLFVCGDQRAVEQIVVNLVDNAVKYSPPNTRVEISGSGREDRIVLRVKDEGPGIDGAHQSRIFERFYRVDKGRSREMGGTGLGLSIVKHLITTMQGEVRCESAPGQGASFFVEFRTASPQEVQAASASRAVIDSAPRTP